MAGHFGETKEVFAYKYQKWSWSIGGRLGNDVVGQNCSKQNKRSVARALEAFKALNMLNDRLSKPIQQEF